MTKVMWQHGLKKEGKTLLDLDHTDNLSVLDTNADKLSKFLMVLRFPGAIKSWKINDNFQTYCFIPNFKTNRNSENTHSTVNRKF